jgi:DNA-binding response OmpR family regulator
MGFCMLDAGTAAGARKTWAAHAAEIDAVIMDLMLPDGNGLNLAREFRKLRPDIVIVFVSGRSCDDPELRSALDRPHTAFVQKPVEIEQLAAVTRNLLK